MNLSSSHNLTIRLATIGLLLSAFMVLSSSAHAGLFSDTDFYVVIQQSPSGKFIDGWVVQGAPKNDNGVYIFTIYGTKFEERVPVQSVVITKVGKYEDALRLLEAKIRDDPNRFHGGF